MVQGWSFIEKGLDTFQEAPLSLSGEYGTGSPNSSSVLLVSAPGAVGKTTLAKQIAFRTGAVYLDLAEAEPVGGNAISGGLVKSGLYPQWESQQVALLIDGLDEARLRVTQEAFEAFLADIAEISKNRSVPTILFGRTGAVQDAWLILDDSSVPVLEIGYFEPQAAVEFADALLATGQTDRPHAPVERKALKLLLDRLRNQTEHDGDRFAGYAPVLQAVAKRVRDENPQALISKIEKGDQPITLQNVVSAILERERVKLSRLNFEDSSLAKSLYSHEEQLGRLAARVFKFPPPKLPEMSPKDADVYETALETWVGEHPFLDGNDSPSSVVFDAVITSHALRFSPSSEIVLRRELVRGVAANPFLAEFYIPETVGAVDFDLPSEHIGIVYSSLRARISLGDSANLSVEGVEEGAEEETLRSHVEITLTRRGGESPRVLHFNSTQVGTIFLGAYIEDVDISAPYCRVEIGPGAEAVFVAPINIQCDQLIVSTGKVIAESPSGREDASIFLEATKFDGISVSSVPLLRGDVSLAVSWPNARNHPWTSFATNPTPFEDPQVHEALRRLRKFVIAFRSHSKGSLARFKDKIEHDRMVKGSGKAVLDQMLAEKVVRLDGAMYYLDPIKLGEQTGQTYSDCMAHRFSHEAIGFVKRALK